MSNQEAANAVYGGYRLPPPENVPKDIWAMILKCWSWKADQRPSFDEIEQVIVDNLGSNNIVEPHPQFNPPIPSPSAFYTVAQPQPKKL